MQVDTTSGLEKKRLAVGDQVLVLIPSSSHKLLKKWMGPASFIELPRPHTARVKMDDGSEKELHLNKLRPYIARIEQIGLIFDQDDELVNFIMPLLIQ
ncbi:retrovirus-related Pol polyprotein from transposon opus [Trichonephila clavata]|uniref:Retrovirus-related Pol polyprotein from transposon opus n=1 Tax=Trichonephila clavata TaxID=2740835 RepID=A0A8X6G910_TRICU|nr:retrovirus-related Pol polyprotein from transposon opus [Trichonephila clavata]